MYHLAGRVNVVLRDHQNRVYMLNMRREGFEADTIRRTPQAPRFPNQGGLAYLGVPERLWYQVVY